MLRKFFVPLMIICASIFNLSLAECKEVMFVINSGETMNIADPFHEISDSVIWSAESLSNADEVGIITFDTAPRVVRPLSKVADNPVANFQINYQGKNNASAALLQAVDILSKKFDTDRAIIFVTDGENLLDRESQNEIFVENVKAGLKQAQWLGIPVYILSLRADVNPQNYHSYEWAKEIPINYLDLMTTIRTIIHNDLHAPHVTILGTNVSQNNLSFEVPIATPEKLKILLMTSSAGKAELLNVEKTTETKRDFVKVFEITAPKTNQFELAVDYPQGTGLTVDVIPTVKGFLEADISTQIFSDNILEITPFYIQNHNAKIFDSKFFNGKTVNLQINDKNFVGVVENGTIKTALDGVGDDIFLQKVQFENLGVNFEGFEPIQLKNPTVKIVWLIALAAILTILILSWRIQKKNPQPLKNLFLKSASAKNVSYNGKLKIQTTVDEVVTISEFNLFRVNDSQISLSKILEDCSIENSQKFAGIIINPATKGILIQNNSPCTITKDENLISQGQATEMVYGDSIVITPEFENSALILTFESLKPN